MNVQTITESKEVAQAKLEAYQRQLHRRADLEYEAAAAGYAAMADGKALLNLTQVINDAGAGKDNRPLLAVARADRKQVMVTTNWHDSSILVFDTQKSPNSWNQYTGTLRIEIQTSWNREMSRGYSLVPMVPADVRPSGNLKNFFILWEVEHWSDKPLTAIPDRDPLLLRHLAGDLYVVVAEWDLTDLERAIMMGRRGG